MTVRTLLGVLALTSACSFDGTASPVGTADAANLIDATSLPACATDNRYTQGVISLRVESEADQTWDDARAVCLAEGADLAVLDTEIKRTAASELTQSGHTWVGLRAQQMLVWQWVDGNIVNVTQGQDGWGDGKPDVGPPGQACARFRDDGLFDDESCNDARDFACECPR